MKTIHLDALTRCLKDGYSPEMTRGQIDGVVGDVERLRAELADARALITALRELYKPTNQDPTSMVCMRCNRRFTADDPWRDHDMECPESPVVKQLATVRAAVEQQAQQLADDASRIRRLHGDLLDAGQALAAARNTIDEQTLQLERVLNGRDDAQSLLDEARATIERLETTLEAVNNQRINAEASLLAEETDRRALERKVTDLLTRGTYSQLMARFAAFVATQQQDITCCNGNMTFAVLVAEIIEDFKQELEKELPQC